MREINSNLDPASYHQMFEIVARETIEELEKTLEKEAIERLELDKRIKVLEEARKKQIEINTQLLAKKVLVKEEPAKFNFWPWK